MIYIIIIIILSSLHACWQYWVCPHRITIVNLTETDSWWWVLLYVYVFVFWNTPRLVLFRLIESRCSDKKFTINLTSIGRCLWLATLSQVLGCRTFLLLVTEKFINQPITLQDGFWKTLKQITVRTAREQNQHYTHAFIGTTWVGCVICKSK